MRTLEGNALRRLSKSSVTSITQGSEIFNYDKFNMLGYKSGTNSQIWVKLDIIMQKIRSRVLMDSENHISEWVHQVKKHAIWRCICRRMNQKSIKKQNKLKMSDITFGEISIAKN